jgi:hypothetical protein
MSTRTFPGAVSVFAESLTRFKESVEALSLMTSLSFLQAVKRSAEKKMIRYFIVCGFYV